MTLKTKIIIHAVVDQEDQDHRVEVVEVIPILHQVRVVPPLVQLDADDASSVNYVKSSAAFSTNDPTNDDSKHNDEF